jgi:hypothetical protein
MIGEYLYQLTLKDAQTAPVIQRSWPFILTSQATGVITNVHEVVPQDKILVISQLTFLATAGAAQTFTSHAWAVRSVNQTIAVLADYIPPSALLQGAQAMYCDAILMPGEQLLATALFSAGAVANTIRSSYHGYYLPKGNLQLR